MNPSNQSRQALSKDASFPQNCRAELLFYAQTGTDPREPAKVLGEYSCDYTKSDWERRWTEWTSHRNPYVHLFLCTEHAKKLGLIPQLRGLPPCQQLIDGTAKTLIKKFFDKLAALAR